MRRPWKRTCPTPHAKAADRPRYARLYAAQAAKAERLGMAERRTQLLAGLSGRVLEIGAGTGLNFGRYPETVTEVVAVEPERHLRAMAEAAPAAVPVRVVAGVAERLPCGDEEFDAVVVSLALCSVADPRQALTEARRVLERGGELRFLEHVASQRRSVGLVQRLADATLWPHVAGGCHLHRDTGSLITEAGFSIERCEAFPFGIPPFDPPKRHIIGVARS
jgi:ubiquinone/menaquinone biosynthesis C-methylase UbiE